MTEKAAAAGTAINDITVTTKVKAALMAEPGLDSLQLHVEIAGGVVKLTGTADNAENREQAEHVASTVLGVTEVRNHLIVRSQS